MAFQFRKESIEEDLNSTFPSQGQGNPPLYYSLATTVVPTYSVNAAAEGSGLPQMLQTAWDFSTGTFSVQASTSTIINNTGFWLIDVHSSGDPVAGSNRSSQLYITDGLTNKPVYRFDLLAGAFAAVSSIDNEQIVVFLRSGDSLVASADADMATSGTYRQIAAVNGDLINPLGFSFA